MTEEKLLELCSDNKELFKLILVNVPDWKDIDEQEFEDMYIDGEEDWELFVKSEYDDYIDSQDPEFVKDYSLEDQETDMLDNMGYFYFEGKNRDYIFYRSYQKGITMKTPIFLDVSQVDFKSVFDSCDVLRDFDDLPESLYDKCMDSFVEVLAEENVFILGESEPSDTMTIVRIDDNLSDLETWDTDGLAKGYDDILFDLVERAMEKSQTEFDKLTEEAERIIEFSNKEIDALQSYMEWMGESIEDVDFISFQESYCGSFRGEEEFAINCVEQGLFGEIPKQIEYYIDYQKIWDEALFVDHYFDEDREFVWHSC